MPRPGREENKVNQGIRTGMKPTFVGLSKALSEKPRSHHRIHPVYPSAIVVELKFCHRYGQEAKGKGKDGRREGGREGRARERGNSALKWLLDSRVPLLPSPAFLHFSPLYFPASRESVQYAKEHFVFKIHGAKIFARHANVNAYTRIWTPLLIYITWIPMLATHNFILDLQYLCIFFSLPFSSIFFLFFFFWIKERTPGERKGKKNITILQFQ